MLTAFRLEWTDYILKHRKIGERGRPKDPMRDVASGKAIAEMSRLSNLQAYKPVHSSIRLAGVLSKFGGADIA
jgi:hypothetical protein